MDKKLLKMCGFSDEMVDHSIASGSISTYDLSDIICRAPISAEQKKFLLDELQNKNEQITEAKSELNEFLSFMSGKTTIYLFSEWYDLDDLMHKSSPCGLFHNLMEAEKYIRAEEKENETGEGYYRMELWDGSDELWERPRYDAFFYEGNICWFEKLEPQKQEHGNTYYMCGSRRFAAGKLDINIDTPYKTGDIVSIDCRPFGPLFHAMILEARDQWDCCMPTVIFRVPGTDDWRLTPLKHRAFYKDISWGTYEPMLSPLFRLKRVKEKETAVEEDLRKISSMIAGNETTAEKIWKSWNEKSSYDLKWNEVMDIFLK